MNNMIYKRDSRGRIFMKILYMGTPEFSKTCLNELITNNFDIRLVITNEDKKTGRGMKIMKTAVKILAEGNNIEVYQPKSLRNRETIEKIKKINPDIIVVVAYGKILPKEILEIPKYGCINVHRFTTS